MISKQSSYEMGKNNGIPMDRGNGSWWKIKKLFSVTEKVCYHINEFLNGKAENEW